MPDPSLQTPPCAILTRGTPPVVVEALSRGPTLPRNRRAATVRAVIPCYNRPRDLELLLGDLARLDLETAAGVIDLSVVIVDNASEPPLPSPPAGGPVRVLRLTRNSGGSGGFNAGLTEHLERWPTPAASTDYLWLVDSDVRLRQDTLRVLVETLGTRGDLVAVGAALADPESGEVFETGGLVSRRDGTYGPALDHAPAVPDPVACDYVAACCALVRRRAVERAGLMPDRFINGDDVEWFIRLARRTGLRVAAVPRAVALHPRFDRFPTWTRAYATRNAFGPIDALRLGRAVRLQRALRAVGRAVNQAMMGRTDLAALHLAGLREAAAGRTTGPLSSELPAVEPFRPLSGLGAALREHVDQTQDRITAWFHPALDLPEKAVQELRRQVDLAHAEPQEPGVRSRSATDGWAAALRRAALGPTHDIAVVPAEGRPSSWFHARVMAEVVPEGFVIRRMSRPATLWAGIATAARALLPALRAGLRAGDVHPRAASPRPVPAHASRPSLSIVVLSHNRKDALRTTLSHLHADPALRATPIIVADNGSADGSPAMVSERFPGARLLGMGDNLGVAAFNRAVESADADLILLLDDDARPDPAALGAAVDLLARRADLAAVALHPRHPADNRSEWPFAEGTPPSDNWPVMGCANLVRREDYLAVGGYEGSFFLYRNDTDLAMKLLGAGRGVAFDPSWVVWHDSPGAARKSARWFETATRNWWWLARRHGTGPSEFFGAVMGWLWAHWLAGISLPMHWRVLRGAWAGIVHRPAPLPDTVTPDGVAFARLVLYQLTARFRRTGNATSPGGAASPTCPTPPPPPPRPRPKARTARSPPTSTATPRSGTRPRTDRATPGSPRASAPTDPAARPAPTGRSNTRGSPAA